MEKQTLDFNGVWNLKVVGKEDNSNNIKRPKFFGISNNEVRGFYL